MLSLASASHRGRINTRERGGLYKPGKCHGSWKTLAAAVHRYWPGLREVAIQIDEIVGLGLSCFLKMNGFRKAGLTWQSPTRPHAAGATDNKKCTASVHAKMTNQLSNTSSFFLKYPFQTVVNPE
jgi:hypothetical protein